MRNVVFAAALATALAALAGPAAAEHLHSYGQHSYGQHSYGQPSYDQPWYGQRQYGLQPQSGYPPRGPYHGRERRSRTGLDRPYGGHGVPYRTPPQGWPDRAN